MSKRVFCFKITIKAVVQQTKRISGEGFPLFSGTGSGSFGLLRSFLVETGLTVIVSENKHTSNFTIDHKFNIIIAMLNRV